MEAELAAAIRVIERMGWSVHPPEEQGDPRGTWVEVKREGRTQEFMAGGPTGQSTLIPRRIMKHVHTVTVYQLMRHELEAAP